MFTVGTDKDKDLQVPWAEGFDGLLARATSEQDLADLTEKEQTAEVSAEGAHGAEVSAVDGLGFEMQNLKCERAMCTGKSMETVQQVTKQQEQVEGALADELQMKELKESEAQALHDLRVLDEYAKQQQPSSLMLMVRAALLTKLEHVRESMHGCRLLSEGP